MALTQTPLFVLSTGRTGSTLLAKMLNRHPEMTCISDLFEPVGEIPYFDPRQQASGPEFFDVISAPSFPQRIAYWRQQWNAELLFLPDEDRLVSLLLCYTLPFLTKDPMRLYGELREACHHKPRQSMPDSLLWLFDWLRERMGKTVWVERTGGSLPHTRQIVDLWPDARYVHSFRDPREVAISMLSGSFFRLYLELERNPDLDTWDWSVTPPVEELGAMINSWICAAESAFESIPSERMHNFSFEDLLTSPEASLSHVAAFLRGRNSPNSVDRAWARREAETIKDVPRKFPHLDQQTRRRLTASVSESLDILGYR